VAQIDFHPSDNSSSACICDECITVCASILEDDRAPSDVRESRIAGVHPVLNHPLTAQLLAAMKRWIGAESLGNDISEEFAEVRSTALRLMRPRAENDPPK
jgi:hypothetical protein